MKINPKLLDIQIPLKYIKGSTVISVYGTSGALFTLTQLRNWFNVPNANTWDFFVLINNGDGSANPVHFGNCTWVGNTIYVVWDSNIGASTSTRVNYVIFYVAS